MKTIFRPFLAVCPPAHLTWCRGAQLGRLPLPPKIQVMFAHPHFSASWPLPEDHVCFCLHISAYPRMECIRLLSRQQEKQQVCWRLREDPVQYTPHELRAHGKQNKTEKKKKKEHTGNLLSSSFITVCPNHPVLTILHISNGRARRLDLKYQTPKKVMV